MNVYIKLCFVKKINGRVFNWYKRGVVDCIVNYEDKSKCLHFPSSKSGNKKYISKVNYKDNKYDTFEGTKQKQAENMNENNEIEEEEDEEIRKKEKKIVRKQLLSKEDKTKSKLYAVNISSGPKIAYDYEAYMNYKQLYGRI